MEEALIDWLLDDSAITTIAGQLVNWNVTPQGGGKPSIVLSRITGIRDYHMQGPSGLVRSLVQIDCWAGTFTAALTLGRAVIARLSGVGGGDVAGFQLVSLINERHGFEPGAETAERFHRVSLDFELWHSE